MEKFFGSYVKVADASTHSGILRTGRSFKMRPEVQSALVDTFRLLERHGRKLPTNATVFAIVRGLGHKFDDNEAKPLLAKFRPLRCHAIDTPVAHPDPRGITPEPRDEQSCATSVTRAGVVPIPIPIPTHGAEKTKKPKSIKPPIPAVAFGDLEPDVSVFMANLAAENKTGRMLESRIVAVRLELHNAMARHGDPVSFAAGLRSANSNGAPNVRYVLRCAESARDKVRPLFRSLVPTGNAWAALSEKEKRARDPGHIGTPPIEGIR